MLITNDCDKCIHNRICGIRKEYEGKCDEISKYCVPSDIFEYKLLCNFYDKQEVIVR